MPVIRSRDNPRLREAARLLASARERRKTGRCVLEGSHLVAEFLRHGGRPDCIVVDESAVDAPDVAPLLTAIPPERILTVSSALFAQATHLASPSRILAVAPTPRSAPLADARFALLLEGVQDPGNVGTILRSAAAAGVDAVFMSPACAFAWSPKVLRAGQGAHFHVHIVEGAELTSVAARFAGRTFATVVSGAPPVFDRDLRGPVAFAIGGEGGGLSPALADACGARVTIPMPGGFESLNAAVAASICLFEKVRQEVAGSGGPLSSTVLPSGSRR